VIFGPIAEGNMSSITLEGNSLVVCTPYDPDLVTRLKDMIPFNERRWDQKRRAWIISRQYGQLVADIIEDHLGEKIALQQAIFASSKTEIRTLDVRYVGTAKARADGNWIAFGWCEGSWNVIFPETVLRAWFDGIQIEHEPRQASTLYAVLGIKRDANADTIKAAFRRMAFQWHPDRCSEPGAQGQFIRIKEAYDILSNHQLRARYDAGLALEASLDPRMKENYTKQFSNDYRAPLRCGYVLAAGQDRVGRFVVSQILAWEDIHNAQGQTLVVSWPHGADLFIEQWF
jgi:hypothetical protein